MKFSKQRALFTHTEDPYTRGYNFTVSNVTLLLIERSVLKNISAVDILGFGLIVICVSHPSHTRGLYKNILILNTIIVVTNVIYVKKNS